jgi:hypothetical protein
VPMAGEAGTLCPRLATTARARGGHQRKDLDAYASCKPPGQGHAQIWGRGWPFGAAKDERSNLHLPPARGPETQMLMCAWRAGNLSAHRIRLLPSAWVRVRMPVAPASAGARSPLAAAAAGSLLVSSFMSIVAGRTRRTYSITPAGQDQLDTDWKARMTQALGVA